MKTPSLHRRLVAYLLLTVGCAGLIAMIANHIETRHHVSQLLDNQLRQFAQTVLGFSGHELLEQQAMSGLDEHVNEIDLSHLKGFRQSDMMGYQIWQQDGTLIVRSPNLSATPLATHQDGLKNVSYQGQHWRVFALRDPDHALLVYAAERLDVREHLIDTLALRLNTSTLLSLPLFALAIWFGVRRALQPLQHITRELGSRDTSPLHPVDSVDTPSEIRPLIQAMNRLFERIEQTMDHERRFTADAAHELRTPLAALKTHAQVAMRASDDSLRQQALRDVITGVERATHLVSQLLTLARIDPEADLRQLGQVNLHDVLTHTIIDLLPVADQKSIELSLENSSAVFVAGSADALAILCRNLIDNAIRYTPAAGQVQIDYHAQPDRSVSLSVEDSGPGIPANEISRVMERFHRLNSAEQGSGLGLSIVKRITELHQATLHLGSGRLGGLRVTIQFPALTTHPDTTAK